MTSTTEQFTPGESVEILYFTDDLSSWERGWQPATYVSPYAYESRPDFAHIVNCAIGDKIVAFNEIRKAEASPDPEPARSTEELRRRGMIGQDEAR